MKDSSLWVPVFGVLEAVYSRMVQYLTDVELWIGIGIIAAKILAVLVLAKILITIAQSAVNRIFRNRRGSKLQLEQRRVDTIRVLVNNVVRYVIKFLAVLIILQLLGIDLRPVLVSAGVLGLAVGFGAQSLVRDVITGFFIIFEDQFAVGDYVTINNNITGTVQEIGLRVTKISSWTGEVHIFANGTINQVTNYSLQNTMAVVDVTIGYKEDLEKVKEILEGVLQRAQVQISDIVRKPDFLGVQALSPSEVVLRVTAECKPNTHQSVARELRGLIRTEFAKHGI